MSEVLDRIRRELQERLESTRAAAREHERVRAALEALEHAARPLEKAARQAASGASRRGRTLAASARPASGREDSAAAGPDVQSPTSARPTSAPQRRGQRSPKSGGGRPASRARTPTAKSAAAASKPRTQRASRKPARARAPRGANRAAVLAVVRERPGVSASELAAASGVTGGTLYALLRRLTDQGELAKRELPGGQTGYAIVGTDADATTAGESDGGDASVAESPELTPPPTPSDESRTGGAAANPETAT
jgi:hypothetical protein